MRFALLLIIISLNAFAASPEYSKLSQALALLSKDQNAEAYAILDTIPVDAPEYRVAFIEMQKIHYKDAAWDKFFGFATFYRTQLLGKFIEPDALMLESLALTKHCQFEPAQKVLSLAKAKLQAARPRNQELLVQLQAVEDLLYLQLKMPGNIQTQYVSAHPKAFASEIQWNVADDQKAKVATQAVKNPRALRVYVKNICEGQVL